MAFSYELSFIGFVCLLLATFYTGSGDALAAKREPSCRSCCDSNSGLGGCAKTIASMSGTGNEQPTQILQFTPDSDVRIIGDTVLLVTHVSSTFDPDQSARDGINRSVHFARHHGIPLVYLIDSQETSSYYFDDWHPNYAVESAGGEFFFDLSTPHVLVAGGYLDQCLRTTVQTALRRIQAAKTELDLRLSLITDAIFEGALLSQTRTLQEWIREAQATGRESELISGLIRRLVRPPPETWT